MGHTWQGKLLLASLSLDLTFSLQAEYVTPTLMENHNVIHWEAAANLADSGLQVTGLLRTQRSAVGLGKWKKHHFNHHKRPGFSFPKIGDLVCLNNLPKGKGLLLGVPPVGAEGSQATQWMCPCGWRHRVSNPAK